MYFFGGKMVFNQVITAYFVKKIFDYMIPDCLPFDHIRFQMSAHQNPFFTVSMDTDT